MKSKNYTNRSTVRALDFQLNQLKYLMKFGNLTKEEYHTLYEAYEKVSQVRSEAYKRCPNAYGEWKKYLDRETGRKTRRQNQKRLARERRRMEATKDG